MSIISLHPIYKTLLNNKLKVLKLQQKQNLLSKFNKDSIANQYGVKKRYKC